MGQLSPQRRINYSNGAAAGAVWGIFVFFVEPVT
jgi:hypothetical protein